MSDNPISRKRVVEVSEDAVDEILGDGVRQSPERLEAAQDKPGMQRQELESAVQAVGRVERLKERRAARRGHDLAQNLLDECFARAPRAPVGEDH